MNGEEKKIKLTLDNIKAEQPELYKKVFDAGAAEGRGNERKLLMEVVDLCDDDLGLAIQCYTEGKTVMEILWARNKKLQAALSKLQQGRIQDEAEIDVAEGDVEEDET